MAAFIFPNPADQTTVENPITGVKYEWKEDSGKWVITTAHITASLDQAFNDLAQDVSDNTVEISEHEGRLDSLEALPVAKEYMLGTDKTPNRNAPAAAGPQLELVDSAGYFSNVKFEATGGLSVSSSASSIIIDGSGIDTGGDVSLDDYYTKDEIDNQLSLRGVGYTYLVSSFSGGITIRPGEMHLDNRLVGQITTISLAPEDENGKLRRSPVVGDTIEIYDLVTTKYYRYLINSGADGNYAVTYQGGQDIQNDPLSLGAPYLVYLYPTHISAANYYDKVEADERFLSLQPGLEQSSQRITTFQASLKYTGDITYRDHVANKGYVDDRVAALATIQYINDEIDKLSTSFAVETAEPDIFYGDYAPTGDRKDGDMWFDSMNLRLNIWSQGAWINPDRNDGKELENRITELEARIIQLEGN